MRTTLPLLSFVVLNAAAFGQLPNGGFEDLDSLGLPVQWQGNRVILHLWVDIETGVFHSDSVEFDGPSNYFLNTTEPHSGANAMELRNGYNHTTGEPIRASWSVAEDTVSYAGFPILTIPSGGRPAALTFFGAVHIEESDEVMAEITVLDGAGFEIGHGTRMIVSSTNGYEAFEVPVTYETTDAAAFMQVRFATAAPDAPATLGTRFLIDDVAVTMDASGVHGRDRLDAQLHLAPNPAHDLLRFTFDGTSPVLALDLLDASGRRQTLSPVANSTVDVSSVAAGVYTLQARTAQGIAQQRFVVRH